MDKGLVFIHGFGGCALMWQWQKDYFGSRGQKVLAVDLPGHGGRPWNGEALDDMARMIVEECRARGFASADMVASSFGGLVMIRVCTLYPDFARRIIFAGSLPKFTASHDFPAGLSADKIRKLAGQFDRNIGTVLDMFFRSMFSMKERENPQYEQIRHLRSLAALPTREALLSMLDMLEREDLRAELGALKVFSLFLLGDSDPICPLTAAEPLRKLCPMGRIEAFKDTGHFPFLTIPDVFNRRVERFIL
jgi:pimeloyl-[acyl-carrier protein] methyl ester esterase